MSGFIAVPRSTTGRIVAVLVLAVVLFLAWRTVGNALGNLFGGAAKAAALQVELDSAEARIVRQSATLDTVRLTLSRKDTVLQAALAEAEAARTRTGPIRWRVRVDTVTQVIDSTPEVVIGIDTVGIPREIAEEVQSCRRLAVTCEGYRQTADSLGSLVPELLGSLATRDTLIERMRHLRSWDLGLFRLPKPDVTCGLYGGYRLTGAEVTIQGEGSASVPTVSGGVGCVVGFKVWGLR